MIHAVSKKFLVLALSIFSVFIFTGCLGKKVENTSTISMKYTAYFQDDSIYEEKEIAGIILGQGQIAPGLEEGIIGMSKGDIKRIVISPDKGYGKFYDPAKVQKLSKDLVGNPAIGSIVKIGNENAVVIGFEGKNSGTVVLDINPKNTRQDLNYDVTITNLK